MLVERCWVGVSVRMFFAEVLSRKKAAAERGDVHDDTRGEKLGLTLVDGRRLEETYNMLSMSLNGKLMLF